MSGSSNLDSFRDGWKVAVQLLLCRVLPPRPAEYGLQHSCVIAVKLFQYRSNRCLEKTAFYFIGQV